MRTSVDLPAALVAECQALADALGTTLSDLAASGLARELAARRRDAQEFVFPTTDGLGLVEGHGPHDAMALAYNLSGMPSA